LSEPTYTSGGLGNPNLIKVNIERARYTMNVRCVVFPNPPEVYVGSDKQREILKRSYERKIKYMKEINGPIWSAPDPSLP
jgi:hypothetical protein